MFLFFCFFDRVLIDFFVGLSFLLAFGVVIFWKGFCLVFCW